MSADRDEDHVMIHANALLLGSAGVLLRGPSGAGKSGLGLELIHLAQGRGLFARLIGDDRVALVRRHGRLVARPHPAIAGAIEERGRGSSFRPNSSRRACCAVSWICAGRATTPRIDIRRRGAKRRNSAE